MQHIYTYLLFKHSLPFLYGSTVAWLKKEVTRLRLRRRGSFVDANWLTLVFKPVWEKDYFKALIGAPLVAAVITGGVMDTSKTEEYLSSWTISQPVQNILTVDVNPPDGVIRTTYMLPITKLNGISQTYHLGHPGIDLTAPIKTPVVAMEKGKVSKVAYERFGYGNNIVIEHDLGLATRYAHLSFVEVKEGQEVNAGQVLGGVGTTGWSTGPHLHFEVTENGEKVNPVIYLYKAIELYQQNILPKKS